MRETRERVDGDNSLLIREGKYNEGYAEYSRQRESREDTRSRHLHEGYASRLRNSPSTSMERGRQSEVQGLPTFSDGGRDMSDGGKPSRAYRVMQKSLDVSEHQRWFQASQGWLEQQVRDGEREQFSPYANVAGDTSVTGHRDTARREREARGRQGPSSPEDRAQEMLQEARVKAREAMELVDGAKQLRGE